MSIQDLHQWTVEPLSQWSARTIDGELVYVRFDTDSVLSMGVGSTWSKAVKNMRCIERLKGVAAPADLSKAGLIAVLDRHEIDVT